MEPAGIEELADGEPLALQLHVVDGPAPAERHHVADDVAVVIEVVRLLAAMAHIHVGPSPHERLDAPIRVKIRLDAEPVIHVLGTDLGECAPERPAYDFDVRVGMLVEKPGRLRAYGVAACLPHVSPSAMDPHLDFPPLEGEGVIELLRELEVGTPVGPVRRLLEYYLYALAVGFVADLEVHPVSMSPVAIFNLLIFGKIEIGESVVVVLRTYYEV